MSKWLEMSVLRRAVRLHRQSGEIIVKSGMKVRMVPSQIRDFRRSGHVLMNVRRRLRTRCSLMDMRTRCDELSPVKCEAALHLPPPMTSGGCQSEVSNCRTPRGRCARQVI